jgi:DUF971 family protein
MFYAMCFLLILSPEVRGHDGQWKVPPHRRGVGIYKMEPVGNYAVR